MACSNIFNKKKTFKGKKIVNLTIIQKNRDYRKASFLLICIIIKKFNILLILIIQ